MGRRCFTGDGKRAGIACGESFRASCKVDTPFGYLLAAIAARLILPHFGWRWMFWVGGIPALLALYIRSKVPESEAWLQHKLPSFGAILRETHRYWKRFLFLIVLMTLMMFLSHGTQDLYPDFLKHEHHHWSPNNVAYIVMLYNVGAILGAILFGQVSEKFGRRYGMLVALALALLMIPLWAFGWSVASLRSELS